MRSPTGTTPDTLSAICQHSTLDSVLSFISVGSSEMGLAIGFISVGGSEMGLAIGFASVGSSSMSYQSKPMR
ncbi:hypothetical protein ACIA8O_38645 [Kitasatospora sp. NPDC051853]|uniref:hypothetical protein n=1 Tax=Kitasatospora sp. NPDC051853 TaxID=3364058 RepID=UPI00379A8C5C